MKYDLKGVNTEDFIKIIKSRLGLSIHANQVDNLLRTISSACDKFACEPVEFLEMIKSEGHVSPALEYLSENITIGETYFFRDKKQMILLHDVILPKIIEDKRISKNLSIRIWSAGCSSGEEIYTVAMLLKELIPDISRWSIFLLGTDISAMQLRKAVKGVYSEWSMRSISKYYKNKYFFQKDGYYCLSDAIKSMAQFSYLNLNDGNYPSILNNTNAMDLVICRNVLIYFDDESISRLISRVSRCVSRGGFLLLGASDPVNLSMTNLTRHPDHSMLWVRWGGEPVVADKKQNTIIHEDADVSCVVFPRDSKNRDKIISTNITVGAKSVDPTELANEGRLQEAVAEFKRAIDREKTNKKLYLNFAMTLIELNRLSEAEEALRKAIYLDSKYVMAHLQLGMLKLRMSQRDEGVKSLTNALRIVKHQKPNDEVDGYPGMDYGRLSEILEKEIVIFHE